MTDTLGTNEFIHLRSGSCVNKNEEHVYERGMVTLFDDKNAENYDIFSGAAG
jgi:hypothetical protein